MLISIANQKGGVGKTTISISLSNFLNDNNKELVVVDFDFQSSFFGLWEEEKNLFDNEPPYLVIQKKLSDVEEVLNIVKKEKESIVLFDLPGKLDDDNLIPVFQKSDLLVIPFSYDKISVESTVFFIQMVQHINKKLDLIFIPNRIKHGVKHKTQSQVNDLLNGFGIVTQTIPDRVCFQRLSTYSNTNEVQELIEKPYKLILKKVEK